jgi:hypothetical protein
MIDDFDDYEAISKGLIAFAEGLDARGVPLHSLTADQAAAEFRTFFDLPIPVTEQVIADLVNRLRYTDFNLKPEMEHMCDKLGAWVGYRDRMRVLVSANRPVGSRTKTALHELIEPLWKAYRLYSQTPYTDKEREAWCNRFAAMVKMPPNTFVKAALKDGIDFGRLTSQFDDTLAGVARQLRDTVFANGYFYYCRFDVVHRRSKNGADQFKETLTLSDGICVRFADVVKSKSVITPRERDSSIPMYILPKRNHYRILNPLFKPYLDCGRGIYVHHFPAYAALGVRQLHFPFCEGNNLAMLIQSYGRRRRGFFMILLPSCERAMLNSQLDRLNVDVRDDIDWVFSLESFSAKKPKPKRPQPGFPIIDRLGRRVDMSLEPYLWPGVNPTTDGPD